MEKINGQENIKGLYAGKLFPGICGGKSWCWTAIRTRKTTQLFQLLMLHTEDGGISKAAMIEALYGRVEVENKNSSLNNTIFRLRKQLKDIGLPESKYINIQSGMCCWDENIKVWVDVCEFKRLVEQVRTEKKEKVTGYSCG